MGRKHFTLFAIIRLPNYNCSADHGKDLGLVTKRLTKVKVVSRHSVSLWERIYFIVQFKLVLLRY